MVSIDDMREQILNVAQELVQTVGYEGFSYADIADRVGIRKASIHHHFPRKSDLGERLIERFRDDCRARLDSLPDGDAMGRLLGFVELFRASMRAGRMCLCGILAAGFANLSGEVRSALLLAIADQEAWLARTFEEGQSLGSIREDVPAETLARNFMGGLEGALLLSRVHQDPGRFESAVVGLIEAVQAPYRSGSTCRSGSTRSGD